MFLMKKIQMKTSPYTLHLLRKSPYSVLIRENTDQKKLRIWTLFMQCYYQRKAPFQSHKRHSKHVIIYICKNKFILAICFV